MASAGSGWLGPGEEAAHRWLGSERKKLLPDLGSTGLAAGQGLLISQVFKLFIAPFSKPTHTVLYPQDTPDWLDRFPLCHMLSPAPQGAGLFGELPLPHMLGYRRGRGG